MNLAIWDVYGTWHYKILNIKKYVSTTIWEENGWAKFGHCSKTWIKAKKNQWKTPLHYNKINIKHNPTSGPPYRLVVHPRHQTSQGDSVAQPGILLLIIRNCYLVCDCDIKEVHLLSNPLSEQDVRGQYNPRKMDVSRDSIPYMNNSILNNLPTSGTGQRVLKHIPFLCKIFMQQHVLLVVWYTYMYGDTIKMRTVVDVWYIS